VFEVTRSFSQSDVPAACPRDGASATRLFAPPLDLLLYRREPIVDTRPPTIPPGALSCHDHGPPAPTALADRDSVADLDSHGQRTGSQWHAHGYEPSVSGGGQAGQQERTMAGGRHENGRGHAHGHGHHHHRGHGPAHSH
jgi:hypothetical protein